MIQREATNVTIFTDMSHLEGITGYAYYIRSDYAKKSHSGAFIDTDNNSFKNEFYAIGMALKEVKRTHEGKNIKTVYIYCDNQSCITFLKNYIKGKPNENKDMAFIERATNFLNEMGYNFEPRKVKGHTAGKCIRTRINNWMDDESRKMRKKIQELLGRLKK